ncbi:HAD family hydrolase [Sinisalibacter lacisalsi]|uniref:phosphoglycolate phosphatase n=1 Tax=Sinisalibacter lacisalsi TaxID=1526570 RepID=A0ABQ1QT35_9RHOB|nr:HAD family hydrolase [Sinisalibacter lacisalsi]GGD43034.1 phosphatase [Sinisalibacter lacisalsi]
MCTGPERRADGVLFDKDGTLFDFDATWVAWVEALIAHWGGQDAARRAALAAAVGFDLAGRAFHPGSVAIAGTPEETARALAPVVGLPAAALVDRLNEEAALAPMAEAVPLAPLLGGLRSQGLRLGVATNDAEAPARAHLSAAGVLELFDFIAGSDSGHGGKPGPGMCQAFARATGLAPGRVVMVGDSTHDLIAGRAAGMQVVAVLSGPAGVAELGPLADAVLPDIGHLPGWLAA